MEAGPAGIGRRSPAHVISAAAPDRSEQPTYLEPIVAQAGFSEPACPSFEQSTRRGVTGGFPIPADHERPARGPISAAMRLFVCAEHFRPDATPLAHARRAQGNVPTRRLRQNLHT